MKITILAFAAALISFGSAAQNELYLLADNDSTNRFLIEYIAEEEQQGKITGEPLLVIDGIPLYDEFLKEHGLALRRRNIESIECLDKDGDTAKDLYGERGAHGVVLITTRPEPETSLGGKVMFIVDGMQVPRSILDNMDPNKIESLQVIKQREEMLKYTQGDYEGIVMIKLKGKEKN